MANGADRYREAGVDLDAGDLAKEGLRALIDSTRDARTLSGLGSFGGLYEVPTEIEAPVLVSSADGVGTKLKVAFTTGRHGSVGECLVNHCVNDILVQGAIPLFFLDYLATGVLDGDVVQDVVAGVARGCKANGCALLGGETAQMPDFYDEGEYDLAGFIVGIVSRRNLLDGSRVQPGDRLIGLPSSGLHTNGYTLARAIVFPDLGLAPSDPFPGEDANCGEVLLRVHRTYLDVLKPWLTDSGLHALAHITGGGIPGNLPRVLGEGLGARIESSSWEIPNLFRVLEERGRVDRGEMFRVFNMGVGMIAVVASERADVLLAGMKENGEAAWDLGEVTSDGQVYIV
jgi:phosphoribosylformylglycinamidine cyclo-ligase